MKKIKLENIYDNMNLIEINLDEKACGKLLQKVQKLKTADRNNKKNFLTSKKK